MNRALSAALAQLAAPVTRPFFGGLGAILMLHTIAEPPGRPRVGWCDDIETPLDRLRELLALARRRRYEIVSLDVLCDRIARGESARRCFVITFDDGYADVYTRAYPLLRGEGVPFTVYVTTGFLDGTYVPWWYVAERHLAAASSIHLRAGERRLDIAAPSQADRQRAFAWVDEILGPAAPAEVRPLAEALFGERVVAEAVAEMALTWDQTRELSRDPLVTIGAHTVNHRNLLTLPEPDARWELAESKRLLEERLGRPVQHFAYPFGSPPQAGPASSPWRRRSGSGPP